MIDMGQRSSIEWTESTWNPITGCTKISPGCAHCYAERMAKRLKAMGQKNYRNGFNVTIHEDSLKLPLSWKTSQTIFVNSMSDLFHEEIPFDFIYEVFSVIKSAYWHNFQILTKRSKRLSEYASMLPWPENLWMGVTVENGDFVGRVDDLRNINAAVKFLSLEPLIGPVNNLNLENINWVIVGGESGPGSRPIKEEWVRDVLIQCRSWNVPFFFKQWGGVNKKKAGRLLDGKTFDEVPSIENKRLIRA